MPAITGKKRNSYSLVEARQQMIEAIGSDQIEVILGDGTIVHFPHPLFQPRAVKKQLAKFYKRPAEDQDADELAEILFGDDYEAFVEHDGDADDLQFVLKQVNDSTEEVLSGRTPTRS